MKKSFNKYEKAGLPGGPNELKRFTSGFIISERGQWDYPGQPTAVPTPSGRITTEGVEDDLVGIDNLGNTQYMTPDNEYQFEGDMVYEIPQAKKGGSKKPSKKFSKSLMAKNRLFAKNPLLKKSKSVKNKIFDPYSPYFQDGGAFDVELTEDEIEEYRKGGYIVEEINDYKKGGALLTKKVTCKKCGWSWDAADGGNDLTTCHKCGGQGLIHAQNGGNINDISIPTLTRMQPGGPVPESTYTPIDPNFLAANPDTYSQIVNKPETSTEREGSDIGKLKAEYRDKNSMDKFLDEKKRQYLKKNKGLNKAAGVTMENFPEDVLQNFTNEYNYKTNNYAVNKLGKKEGWNPKRRGEWVDELTPGEKDAVAESKYGSKLQPSYWSRSLAGVQELGNAAIKLLPGKQGDVLKYNIPGLTKKEQKEIAESKIGALETLAPMDIPGAAIANLVKNTGLSTGSDYKEQANALAGEKMANVSDTEAMAFNPLTYAGLESLPELGVNLARGIGKGASKLERFVKNARDMEKISKAYNPNLTKMGFSFSSSKPAVDFVGPMRAPAHAVSDVLSGLKNRGTKWDKVGAKGEELLHPDMLNYHGTYAGRPIVEVRMPDGTPEFFYKSSGWAGKEGAGLKGTTEGQWQVFGGFSDVPNTKDWFIKDAGYKDYYGSNTFKGMAENLDNALIQKLGFQNTDELDNAINFQNRFGNVDSYTPIRKYGGTAAKYGYSVGNLIRKDKGGAVSGTQGLTDVFSQRLTQMILDARSQGIDLGVGSGYRSYEKQKRLWEQALKKYGSAEKARKWVAPPGGSFHNKGLAVDLHSSGNALGKEKNAKATEWAHTNAKKYGLHFRMGHEPWHIEPIEASKSKSEDDHDHDDTYGNAPDITTKEEMDLILKNKEIELKEKQQLLAEQERALHDDDYSDWEPSKDEFVDPSKKMLEEYSKIINPSSQNIYALYNANLQGKMKNGGIIVEVDDDEIEELKRGGYVVEELSYAQTGLEQKTVTPDWQSSPTTSPGVFAPPTATTVTKEEIVEEPIVKKEEPIIKSPAPVNKGKVVPPAKDNSVKALQLKLKNAGYDLGKSGPSGDGVDGVMGNKTKVALDAFNAGISPSKIKVPDPKKPIKGQTKNYTVNTNLKDGYLPYLDKGEETCVKGKGCSVNVSIKMGSLLGNITDKSLWANDAWFNKSDILNKGGDLVYENKERDYTKMQKVPKDVWNKLQVGDYVQLNRKDTASSAKFAAQTKAGLKNEGIEHLGFVVGKDKDGTPLIWHGSETGKAYVQRIDEPLSLHDENKISGTNNFTYQVASIVRSPHLKNKDLTGLQNTGYYSPLDPNKKLIPKKGSTETQRSAVDVLNKSIGKFKSIGYKQDDVNYVAQILIGGIMQNETQGGTSNKRVPKEIAATVWKNYLGQGNFERDEASIGYYQLKPHLNFTDKDGKINALGKKLEKLGMSVDDIGSNDINSQTKAGTLLLLDAYSQLKKDKDFNPKTGLYKNKIPASYILAKSWQAGAGWYKKDKYKKYLNNFDVDYSNNALKNLKTIGVAGQNKTARDEYLKYVLPKITKVQPKVYTFPEKKGVKYKKDNFGNWYVNEGSKTQNKFVKINDPEGIRRKTLNAWDKKYNTSQSSKSYKTGGFVMELTEDEIQKYLDSGYVIEDVD